MRNRKVEKVRGVKKKRRTWRERRALILILGCPGLMPVPSIADRFARSLPGFARTLTRQDLIRVRAEDSAKAHSLCLVSARHGFVIVEDLWASLSIQPFRYGTSPRTRDGARSLWAPLPSTCRRQGLAWLRHSPGRHQHGRLV